METKEEEEESVYSLYFEEDGRLLPSGVLVPYAKKCYLASLISVSPEAGKQSHHRG